MHAMHATLPAMSKHQTPTTRPGALSRGLAVLRCLVSSPSAISATEIAARTGMHQSSVSRILAALADDGFVRQTNNQWYEPDLGLLTLSTTAIRRFDLATKPAEVMQEAAQRSPGFTFSLGVLWHGEMLYFLRSAHAQ